MINLPERAAMQEYQKYIHDLEALHGWLKLDLVHNCFLMGEEVGELFKAVRKSEHLSIGTTSIVGTVDEELADILIFVCAVANRYGIDLSSALRRKEEHNEQRVWA